MSVLNTLAQKYSVTAAAEAKPCYCHMPLTEAEKLKGTLVPCKECEKLLDKNSGYNPEEGTANEAKNMDATSCKTIKEYIQKYPKQTGIIYKGKIYTDG